MLEIETIGNLEYVKKHEECITCEFIPLCILCTWVSKNEIDSIFDYDAGIIFDRKYHNREKKRSVKKLYKRYKMVESKKNMDVNELNVIIL